MLSGQRCDDSFDGTVAGRRRRNRRHQSGGGCVRSSAQGVGWSCRSQVGVVIRIDHAADSTPAPLDCEVVIAAGRRGFAPRCALRVEHPRMGENDAVAALAGSKAEVDVVPGDSEGLVEAVELLEICLRVMRQAAVRAAPPGSYVLEWMALAEHRVEGEATRAHDNAFGAGLAPRRRTSFAPTARRHPAAGRAPASRRATRRAHLGVIVQEHYHLAFGLAHAKIHDAREVEGPGAATALWPQQARYARVASSALSLSSMTIS